MTIIDSVYRLAVNDFSITDLLSKAEWDKPAIYNGFLPAGISTDIKVPYLTYQFDISPIDPWPMVRYTIEFDIWDMNDGNDDTTVKQIAERLKDLLDKTEVQDENNNPSTLFNTYDMYLQDIPGTIHRRLIFTLNAVNFSLLQE